jgi:ubiquinone/menaquinone biosynthesis C-methylase UbiE
MDPMTSMTLLLFLFLNPLSEDAEHYTQREPSRDGTGKFYMGREISRFMSHHGAYWLERDTREKEERPSLVLRHMELKPGDRVADIGAGSGYFTFRIASKVPDGSVYAVDIQREMLDIMEERMAEKGITNVVTVLGTVSDPKLPKEGIDKVLMVDAYHEFSHPREMMLAIYDALVPGGRIYLIEYRAEDPTVRIKPLHKMTESQARKEMEAVGFRWITTGGFLPRQHFLVFEKPEKQ